MEAGGIVAVILAIIAVYAAIVYWKHVLEAILEITRFVFRLGVILTTGWFLFAEGGSSGDEILRELATGTVVFILGTKLIDWIDSRLPSPPPSASSLVPPSGKCPDCDGSGSIRCGHFNLPWHLQVEMYKRGGCSICHGQNWFKCKNKLYHP